MFSFIRDWLKVLSLNKSEKENSWKPFVSCEKQSWIFNFQSKENSETTLSFLSRMEKKKINQIKYKIINFDEKRKKKK